MTRPGPETILQRNLTALGEHRPEVAALLHAHASSRGGYRLVDAPDGRRVVTHDDLSRVPGGPAGEQALREALAGPAPAAIAGVGDGRVLGLVASRPAGAHGSTHAVYLCEPDPDRLRAALGASDLTGPGGPIEHPAVRWFVGDRWAGAYRDSLASEPLLPMPDIHARLGVGDEAERVWLETVAAREQSNAAAAEAARAWSESDEVGGGSGWTGAADRAPRVLLITSRFTTVVRHSVAAAARGFASLGWEAHTCTERADHERLTPDGVIHAISGFRPDLILAVNYHRHHFAGVPGGVPFVCWIQDDMLHLIEPGVGDRLGERDFVMSAWAHRYSKEWGYPADRCVVVPRMIEDLGPAALASDEELTDDLVYVSSHSGVPSTILDQLTRATGTHTAQARATAYAGRALIDLYARGGSVAQPRGLRAMLSDAARAEGIGQPDPAWLSRVAELLALHLNNPLYRQQGLAWAARVAGERGRTLAVYGPGWDRHPGFAPFARGPLTPGDDLVRVTRTARFNLRLEPYPAMCHQRLIEAVGCGGMVLSRRTTPGEESEAAMVAFFLEHLAGRARRTHQARELLTPGLFDEWERLVAGYRAAYPHLSGADLVLFCSDRLDDGTLADYEHSPHPPRYFDTVFGDADELGRRVDVFLSDPGDRRTLLAAQHAHIRSRFTHARGLGRLIDHIRDRVAAACHDPCGSPA
jgi:hypothetical protein